MRHAYAAGERSLGLGAVLIAIAVILAVSAVPYLSTDARTEMLSRQLDAVQTQMNRKTQPSTASPSPLPPNLQWLLHPLDSKLQAQAEKLQSLISSLQARRRDAEGRLLVGLLMSVFAFTCWALAYVLGDSFWRPPKT